MNSSRLILAAALAAVVAAAAIAAAYAYSHGLGPGGKAPAQAPLGPHHGRHPAAHGWHHAKPGPGGEWAGRGPLAGVELSPGFQSRVMAVLQNDSRTASLLSEGYTVARIKPLFKLYVEDDGTTTVKAAKAVVHLVKAGEDGERGRAVAIVDLENDTIIRLVVHQAYHDDHNVNHIGHGHSHS